MLHNSLYGAYEAGVDEAGRGCLCGSVFAAAVILPEGFYHPLLNDSKKMTSKDRYELRAIIESRALAWAVADVTPSEIDRVNILNATFQAMNKAIDSLSIKPERLLIDGNRFRTDNPTEHHCIIGGDALYTSIAAASVLAKTYRDDYMMLLDAEFPEYGWAKSKGYPTAEHRSAIAKYGLTKYHRLTFRWNREL